MTIKLPTFMRRITWKHWLLFLILSLSIYALMLTWSIPAIQAEAGGLAIFDMHPLSYGVDEARAFLGALKPAGLALYRGVQLPLDIFFPLFLCAFLLCSWLLLMRLYRGPADAEGPSVGLPFALALCLPIAGMLSDYSENLCILGMLSGGAAAPSGLIRTASVFTGMKSAFMTIDYLAILGFAAVAGTSAIARARRGKALGR